MRDPIDFLKILCYNGYGSKTEKKGGEPVAESTKRTVRRKPTNCETCVYYDYDEDLDAYICTVNLDEDELERFVLGTAQYCPNYRFYDEYKSVQKQN